MSARGSFVLAVATLVVAAACSRSRESAVQATSEMAAPVPSQATCGHAVCADNFFVDVAPTQCVAGSPCSAAIRLGATGVFHINDEYPYRFRADDAPGVEFLGTDVGGKNSFSKPAGDWQKTEEKSGAMTVKFTVADPGAKTIGGTLKLSVCSPQACLLEQRQVTASVVTK